MTHLQETDVLQKLRGRLPRFAAQLDPDLPLRDLGLDSMDTVELLCAIHEEFGIRLNHQEFQPEATLRELAEIIATKLPS